MTNRPLVLLTGGMRRVGAVIAARFAEAGYDLALTSHADTEPEPELAAALAKGAANWRCFMADLSDLTANDPLLRDVSAHFGRTPDVLVNNAAMFGQDDWQHMDAASLHDHFQLNVFAPLLLSRSLVAASNGSRPSIINILDQRIQNPHGDQISYTLSKQALAASVRSMAAAFGGRARVNGVAPGLVISTADYDPEQERRLAALMPLEALPDPQGVADAAVYLADAAHVTGQIIIVDGGAHLKSYGRDFMHL
jgi:NAD(P)-dependent dehydrogenase (short-subunit alcohol dehydrogenase family)